MIYALFRPVLGLFRIKYICVDDVVFKLHYKMTVGVLLLCSLLISTNQLFGDPINCIGTKDIKQHAILETFCWAESTFSLPEAFGKRLGDEVPYPGVDKYTNDKERQYHQYYQWVGFFLFMQAIMFFLPHQLWKAWESGRMRNITLSLDSLVLEEDAKTENIKRLVSYMKDNIKLAPHQFYMVSFYICEMLNFVNVVGQLYFINRFLGGAFLEFGRNLFDYRDDDDPETRLISPLLHIFPRVTKCIFHYFGSSGDVQKYDTMCVLPLNIINEKIYLFLWFWLVLLAVITGCHLLCRVSLLFSAYLKYIVTITRCRRVNRKDLDMVLKKCGNGDWFVIELLAVNLEANNFAAFISMLAKELKKDGADVLLKEIRLDEKAKGIAV